MKPFVYSLCCFNIVNRFNIKAFVFVLCSVTGLFACLIWVQAVHVCTKICGQSLAQIHWICGSWPAAFKCYVLCLSCLCLLHFTYKRTLKKDKPVVLWLTSSRNGSVVFSFWLRYDERFGRTTTFFLLSCAAFEQRTLGQCCHASSWLHMLCSQIRVSKCFLHWMCISVFVKNYTDVSHTKSGQGLWLHFSSHESCFISFSYAYFGCIYFQKP